MAPDRRATIWLLSMCVFWGSTFFTMELGIEGMEAAIGPQAAPSAFLFLRFLLAAALFPLLFPHVLKELTRRVAWHGFLLSLPFYAGFFLQVTGLAEESTTPTVSAFLTNLTVILTPLLGRIFFRETMAWSNVAGAVIALGGVYVLTDPAGGGFGTGELVTVACAVAFAVHIQLTNVITRRNHPETITFVMFVCAVVFSGATLLFMGVSPGDLAASLGERHVVWTLIYTAIVCTIVAITIMNRFQRDVPATRAAVLYTLEPVSAAVLAALFVGEEMTVRKILGGVVILAGNVVCELFAARSARYDKVI